jgi:hypothetical protein
LLPLLAQLRTDTRTVDKRGTVRRSLCLEVQASSSSPDAPIVVVRNLSERGLLIETVADLEVGETIHVELPKAGASPARVVWTDGSFFGCEFISPVSKASVSAALLLAPDELSQSVRAPPSPPGFTYFGDEQERSGLPAPRAPGNNIVLMASLVLALLMVVMFIYALFALPFST